MSWSSRKQLNKHTHTQIYVDQARADTGDGRSSAQLILLKIRAANQCVCVCFITSAVKAVYGCDVITHTGRMHAGRRLLYCCRSTHKDLEGRRGGWSTVQSSSTPFQETSLMYLSTPSPGCCCCWIIHRRERAWFTGHGRAPSFLSYFISPLQVNQTLNNTHRRDSEAQGL